MTTILGISAFYHDSAAALVVDGEVVAAAQEERFTRKKHDQSFPTRAIEYCLAEAGISADAIDHVGFYEKPLLKFDRLLETYLSYAPAGFRSFRKAMPEWAGPKLQLRREIRRGLEQQYQGRICFCEHHESHAASAFFPSPFDQAAILTMDGVGEWATSSLGVGVGNRIDLTDEIRFPHSLGLLYSAFTFYTGFEVNSGEYKLMGLAPYGTAKYVDVIREKLIRIYEDGSYRLNLDYFQYCQGLTMTSRRFHQLFGRPPRQQGQEIDQLDMDLAASIQSVTEEIVLRAATHLHQKTGQRNLCMAGGVALNCVANGRLIKEGPFDRVWVQPAAGDAGGAIGVALLIWHQLMNQPRSVSTPDAQNGSLLGPNIGDDQMESSLRRVGATYQAFDRDSDLDGIISQHLAEGKIVGVARGRMEFGPRALGNRSILADARLPHMQRELNLRTKFRESFRPFAPMVLADQAATYFEIEPEQESPYMLVVADLASEQKLDPTGEPRSGLDRVNEVRSRLPAITHVNGSARLQTVDTIRNPPLRHLLERFAGETGCAVLVNTSFNVRDEPIVCSWIDALLCFMRTNLDVLVLDRFVLLKEDQERVSVEDIESLQPAVDKTGELREATWFVVSLVIMFCVIAFIVNRRFDATTLAYVFVSVAALIAASALTVPASRFWVREAFTKLTWPIRAFVTVVLLAFVYYGMVTPIGWFRRMRGNDLRNVPDDEQTAWLPRQGRDVESYFRTY